MQNETAPAVTGENTVSRTPRERLDSAATNSLNHINAAHTNLLLSSTAELCFAAGNVSAALNRKAQSIRNKVIKAEEILSKAVKQASDLYIECHGSH